MPSNRQIRSHAASKGDGIWEARRDDQHKAKNIRPCARGMTVNGRAELSSRWRGVCPVWVWICFGQFGCQLGSALIGSSSPVSRLSSSRNYTPLSLMFYPPIDRSNLSLLSLRFWLGSATDHRPNTPSTTPFQHPASTHGGIFGFEAEADDLC